MGPDGAPITPASDYVSQPHLIPTSAIQPLLADKRQMVDRAQREVDRLLAELHERQALAFVCSWASGGLVTLNSTHASTFRSKLLRLQRRRTEALGHCIATANAKIAYRVCKQSMAELHGARELLSSLQSAQHTMPCAQLKIVLGPLPNTAPTDELLCVRTLEDVATWMGVTDDRLVLSHFEHEAPEGEELGQKGGKVLLIIYVNLHKELQGASGGDGSGDGSEGRGDLSALDGSSAEAPPAFNPEPAELGEAVITEFLEGRLAGAMVSTAELLGIAKVPIENVALNIPTRQELSSLADPRGDRRRERVRLQSTVSSRPRRAAQGRPRPSDRAAQHARPTVRPHMLLSRRGLLLRGACRRARVRARKGRPPTSPLAVGTRSAASPSNEATEALREAILADPIASKAVNVFTVLRQAAPYGSTPR